MLAAKEKTFSPSSQTTFTWSPRGTHIQAAAKSDRDNLTTMSHFSARRFTELDLKPRKSQKSPIGLKVKSPSNPPWQNQRSPEKTLGENVVQLRRSHWAIEMSQYRAYFVPGGMDPLGLQEVVSDWFVLDGTEEWHEVSQEKISSTISSVDSKSTKLETSASWGFDVFGLFGVKSGVAYADSFAKNRAAVLSKTWRNSIKRNHYKQIRIKYTTERRAYRICNGFTLKAAMEGEAVTELVPVGSTAEGYSTWRLKARQLLRSDVHITYLSEVYRSEGNNCCFDVDISWVARTPESRAVAGQMYGAFSPGAKNIAIALSGNKSLVEQAARSDISSRARDWFDQNTNFKPFD